MRRLIWLTARVAAVALVLTAEQAHGAWRVAASNGLVAGGFNYRNIGLHDGYWRAEVAQAMDPIIILAPRAIDAQREKYLYLSFAVEYANSLQVFFGGEQRFTEPMSFRIYDLPFGLARTNVLIDISAIPEWQGTLNHLRLDFEGCDEGTEVRLYEAGVFARAEDAPGGQRFTASKGAGGVRVLSQRMAAHHHTLVMADERSAGSLMMTYGLDKPAPHFQYILARFMPHLGGVYATGRVARVRTKVEDTPGGVVSEYVQDGVAVRYELLPLIAGRATPAWDGAAMYRIRTHPPAPLTVRVGEGRLHRPGYSMPFLAEPSLHEAQDVVAMRDDTALIRSPHHPFAVAVRSTGVLSPAGTPSNQHLAAYFADGAGEILVGFAHTTDAALATITLAPDDAYTAVQAHYATLLSNAVHTPEPAIDAAFRSALYNLEYAWLAPYGWIESIHHWHMMWHMQHAGAMPWLGLTTRARQCLQSLTDKQLPSGAAPQLTAAGDVHREIFTGGSSQFYAWQVQQYWDYTAATNDALWLGPALDNVVHQVYEEYDPDHDLLLKWDAQIANQEDYVYTPYNGTSPTIEGIAMMRTARQLAAVRGDTARVGHYTDAITRARARLREQLWQPALGRFMYFRDALDVVRPEGQYHTLIFPVIHDLLDPLDSYTSMRHLCDRLMTTNGAVCCGNNFPAHGATSGCQIGAAQQPWGAWGLAAMGMRNRAYQPLNAVAEWVMSPSLRGAWPEISLEPHPAYFSPPAGLYVHAVIEALFGLKLRAADACLELAPAFPDHWPSATLHSADFSAEYARNDTLLTYAVQSATPLRRRLRWLLPAGDVVAVRLNGEAVPFAVSSAVACVALHVETPLMTSSVFEVTLRPWAGTLAHPASMAEGGSFECQATDVRIVRVDDRCSVLSAWAQHAPASITATVATGLLAPYDGYGRLGQLNFSRRTFFVLCETEAGTQFWLPVDLAVLPQYEVAQHGDMAVTGTAATCPLLVRNNTTTPLEATGMLHLARVTVPVPLDIAPRSEAVVTAALPLYALALLSPGDNPAHLALAPDTELRVTVNPNAVYATAPLLSSNATARMELLRLPERLLKTNTEVAGLRDSYGYDWTGWEQWAPQVQFAGDAHTVTVPGLPAVVFTNHSNRFIALSWRSGTPLATLDLKHQTYRKLYLLMQPYLENHDIYTPVARVCVRTASREYVAQVFHTPGDFDYGYQAHPILTTYTAPRTSRHGLLPLLRATDGDWDEGKPPAFPQPAFWTDTPALPTAKGLLNVLELSFDEPLSLASLTIETLGTDAALGVVAVTGERAADNALVQGTPYMPPPGLQDPITILAAHSSACITNWTLEGAAFSVGPQPDLCDGVSFNSKALHGEQAVGKALSPPFEIPHGYARLELLCQGTAGMPGMPNPLLYFDLIDVASGERLVRHHAQGTYHLKTYCLPVGAYAGRTVRLEMVDANNGGACAWIGVRTVRLLRQ